MKDLFTDPIFLTAALTWIAQMVLTPLAKRIPPTNVAWVFIRALHGLFDKIDPPKVPPTIVALFGIGATLLTQGCAGSFDEAKIAGINARKFVPPATVLTPTRCQTLSERQYWFTGAGLASGAIGAAAGTMILPVESSTVDTVLIFTAVAGGVGAAGLGWFGAAAGADYVRECQ
jgi:hypothetical protein